jgi:hypothetical protein
MSRADDALVFVYHDWRSGHLHAGQLRQCEWVERLPAEYGCGPAGWDHSRHPDFIKAENAVGATELPVPEPSGAPAIETHGSPFGLEVGQAEKHDWAPSLGFAYDVFGNGKSVVRGGFGIAYDSSSVHQYEMEVFNNPPYVSTGLYTTAVLIRISSASGSASAS